MQFLDLAKIGGKHAKMRLLLAYPWSNFHHCCLSHTCAILCGSLLVSITSAPPRTAQVTNLDRTYLRRSIAVAVCGHYHPAAKGTELWIQVNREYVQNPTMLMAQKAREPSSA